MGWGEEHEVREPVPSDPAELSFTELKIPVLAPWAIRIGEDFNTYIRIYDHGFMRQLVAAMSAQLPENQDAEALHVSPGAAQDRGGSDGGSDA